MTYSSLSTRTLLSCTTLGAILISGTAYAQLPPRGVEFLDTKYWDTVQDDGSTLAGGRLEEIVFIPHKNVFLPSAGAVPVVIQGRPENRIDIVFVGDGYLESELGLYASQVDTMTAAYFNKEPYIRYAPFFNVHRVDVISNESGVDNDPVQGIEKDTAMDMGFWCGGTERCICVNVTKAYSYANTAPDADVVAAIANSSKYGGCGYSSANLGTTSGGNSAASEVLLHEFGHALGNLADEYHYGDGARYTGNEPRAANVSTYNESAMRNNEEKWWQWLGYNDPNFDGLVSTYEGAQYNQFGIYRPTNNSEMNSLYRQFNLPSIEELLIEIYKIVEPIDASSDTTTTYNGTETLFVDVIDPVGHPCDIQWYVDDLPVYQGNSPTLDLNTLDLPTRPSAVRVVVVDNTEWVRDEAARDQWMTQSLTFKVDRPGERDCLDLDVTPLHAGQTSLFNVYEGTPGAKVAILFGVADGSFVRSVSDWCVDFGFDVPASKVQSRIVAQGRLDKFGDFVSIVRIPNNVVGEEFRFQAAEHNTCPDPCMSEVVRTFVQE